MARTRLVLVAQIQRRLGDTAEKIWSEEEVIIKLNEGYFDFCAKTKCLWVRDTPSALDDVAGQALYDLPSDCWEIERIVQEGVKIDAVNQRELWETDPAFETIQGNVLNWVWGGDGIGKLRKVRVPAASLVGSTTIEYVARPNYLDADGAITAIPNRLDKFLRFYALWKCYEREGQGQDLEMAQHYQQRYAFGVQQALSLRGQMRNFRRSYLGEGTSVGSYRGVPRPVLPPEYGTRIRMGRRGGY